MAGLVDAWDADQGGARVGRPDDSGHGGALSNGDGEVAGRPDGGRRQDADGSDSGARGPSTSMVGLGADLGARPNLLGREATGVGLDALIVLTDALEQILMGEAVRHGIEVPR